MKCVSIVILGTLLTLNIIADQPIALRKVDPTHIAEPVAEIVEHIVVLAQNSDNKDTHNKKEVAIQATAGLLINAIKIVLAATHRNGNQHATQEEILANIASLSDEQLYELSDAIATRAKRIPCITE
jgi:hypothetical protein